MRIPALEAPPATQPKEDEIRIMEARVDPPNQMEDDLHILILQTKYPPTYSEPHFSTTHPSEPSLMPSHTQPPHFKQPKYYSPFPDPHYTPPPEQPSLHELQAEFHALRMDIHDMRDDITSLRNSVDESSDMNSTQMSSLHHHHDEIMAIHDRLFMSLETHLDDFET